MFDVHVKLPRYSRLPTSIGRSSLWLQGLTTPWASKKH